MVNETSGSSSLPRDGRHQYVRPDSASFALRQCVSSSSARTATAHRRTRANLSTELRQETPEARLEGILASCYEGARDESRGLGMENKPCPPLA
eukprot:scaffold53840_cov63-Phaeocystis_antarctica.AAC.1